MLHFVSVVLPAPNVHLPHFTMRYRAGFPPVWALTSQMLASVFHRRDSCARRFALAAFSSPYFREPV